MGDLPFHADDQLIGQAWLWAAQNGEGKKAIAPIRAYFDHVLANRPTIGLEFIPVAPGKGTSTCTDRWCWCDALFMAPPRSEEHTSELQSLMSNSFAGLFLKKKKTQTSIIQHKTCA